MKKLIASVCALLTLSTLFSASASAADTKDFEIKSTAKAPVADGNISKAEYGNNDPIVFDGSGKNTESGWDKNTNWAGHTIKLYYTWDKSNLYVGITVEGEKTASQNDTAPADKDCIWGTNDLIQLGFNPGLIIKDVQPLYYCVGFTADKQPLVHGDAYQSDKDGSQTKYVMSEIKGFSKKYSESGINYACEIAIPWEKIFVKGVCRSGEGAKLFDMSGEMKKLGDGYVLPVFMLYRDKDANVVVRSAGKDYDYTWKAQDMCPIRLVLKETKKTVDTSAQTADISSLIICASLASALGAAVVLRRKH